MLVLPARRRDSGARVEDAGGGCTTVVGAISRPSEPKAEPMMAAPLFEIRELAKVYCMGEVEVHALDGVNLTLNEGEFVVLLGPSGSASRLC
jgi:ABC-type glutathione transport system ATPase component